MTDFEVIVVGAGPAGTAAATLCARQGLRTALVERARFPRHKVCGDVINPNCWPVLERMGVADEVRALPQHPITGVLVSTEAGSTIELQTGSRLVAIRRSLLDACLLRHARASGAVVLEGETVHDLQPAGRVITAQRVLAGRRIVAADGRQSLMAKRAGLWRGPERGGGRVAFQAHFAAPAALDGRVQLHLFDGGYAGLVRVDSDRANLCVVTGRRLGPVRDTRTWLADTVGRNPVFRRLGIGPEPLAPWQSAQPLWRRMNVPAGGGVLLVGDALRVMEPFTGQGIYFALRTGELAAESVGEDGPGAEARYADRTARLYGRQGRANQMLHEFLSHPRLANRLGGLLRHWAPATNWLADNVFGRAQ